MTSKGEANNNPGNLEATPWTKGQPGYIGTDGRFAIFDTITNGIAAQEKLLGSYISRGYDTISKVVNRYGNDPGTQDDLSVSNYMKYLSQRLGLGVNDKINPSQSGALATAMREFETGKKQGGILDSMRNLEKKFLQGLGVSPNTAETLTNPDASVSDAGLSLISVGLASRIVYVVIGVLFIVIAIAAFVFASDSGKKVITTAAKAAI